LACDLSFGLRSATRYQRLLWSDCGMIPSSP
jgi:hypothetical protein